LINAVRRIVERVIDERASLSLVGVLVLIWISTRLVGTLRSVLRRIFEITGSRSVIHGKLFDAQMVVLGGAFIVLNMGVTAAAYWLRDFGISRFEPEGHVRLLVQQSVGVALSFLSLWVLLLLVYQFVAYGRVQWRIVLIASTVTAVITELMKAGFAWYVREVASFRTTYGSLAALAILFFYLYYLSVAFVLCLRSHDDRALVHDAGRSRCGLRLRTSRRGTDLRWRGRRRLSQPGSGAPSDVGHAAHRA
jgi:membrane protein